MNWSNKLSVVQRNWIIIIILFISYNIAGYLSYCYTNWIWSLPMSIKDFRESLAIFEAVFIGCIMIFSFFKFIDT